MAFKFYPIQQGTGDPSPTNVRPIVAPLNITGIGQIWGGEFDLLSGVLTADMAMIDLGTLTWRSWVGYNNDTIYFSADLPLSKDADNVSGLANCICSAYKKAEHGITLYRGTEDRVYIVNSTYLGLNGKVYVRDTDYDTYDMTSVKTAMNGVQLAYELATPITHTLTPSQYAEAYEQLHIPKPNTELMSRRHNLETPHIATATGAVANFSTDIAAPLKECKVEFSPVQSGTGDPSPSNIRPISGWTGVTAYRTGKNLFNLPLEQGSIAGSTGQDVSASNRVRTNGYFYLKGGKAYTVSATGVGQGVVYYYDKNKTFLADQGNLSFADLPRKFTVYRDGYFRIIFRKSSNNESIIPSDISNVQVEISDGTATPYEPYSGNTYPVEFPTMGVNQWDEQWEVGSISTETGQSYQENRIRSKNYIPCVPSTAYYVVDPTNNRNVRIYYYDGDKSYITYSNWEGNTVFTTPANAKYMRFIMAASYGTTYNYDIAINYPSTKTAYEPYTNTVYGGYVDLVKGELVVEWAGYSAKWGTFGRSTIDTCARGIVQFSIPCKSPGHYNNNKNEALCNYGTWKWDYADDNPHFYISGGYLYVFLPVATSDGADVEICVTLETPIIYPLTPQVIKSLKGVNNVFTDTNGDITVKYWKH